LIAHLWSDRTHIGAVIIAICGIRDVAVWLKTGFGLDIGVAEAVVVEVQVPGDDLGIVVDHAVAIVIDAVTLLGRLRMRIRVVIVAILGDLRKPLSFAACADLTWVTKPVPVDVAIERRRLGAASALEIDASVIDQETSRGTGSRTTARSADAPQGRHEQSHSHVNFHD
jgi:hypothetical protein